MRAFCFPRPLSWAGLNWGFQVREGNRAFPLLGENAKVRLRFPSPTRHQTRPGIALPRGRYVPSLCQDSLPQGTMTGLTPIGIMSGNLVLAYNASHRSLVGSVFYVCYRKSTFIPIMKFLLVIYVMNSSKFSHPTLLFSEYFLAISRPSAPPYGKCALS